jgi:hypothetical protein
MVYGMNVGNWLIKTLFERFHGAFRCPGRAGKTMSFDPARHVSANHTGDVSGFCHKG